MKFAWTKINPARDWKLWQIHAAAAAVCAAVTVGGYWFGARPLAHRHAAHAAAVAELDSARRRAADAAELLARRTRELADAQREVDQNPLPLRPASQANQRLGELTALANDCGLTVEEMQRGEPTEGPHFRALPVAVVARGAYRDGARFLGRLRGEFPDVGVRRFEALNTGPNPLAPEPTFRLELTWYSSPSAAAAAAAK